ncbi:MAG: glycosyltransferase [Ignavibacterium sp.]
MKILIITPRIPYPPYRGDKLKIYNIAKILSERNSVTVLTFFENSESLVSLKELEKLGIKTEAVKLSLIESFINLIPNIFSNLPFQVAYFSSKRMKEKIAGLVNREKYDVIYFHLIRSAQYFQAVSQSKALKVLDFTDTVSLYLARFADVTKNPFKKIALKLELKRIKKYEYIAKNFDTLFICSEKDKEFLVKRKVHNNINFLRNGIDSAYFKPDNIEYVKYRIIFTGNIPYYPNRDAVSYFVKDIFPLVTAKYPEAKFYIVGQKPPLQIKQLKSRNIIVTGFVEDIHREYLLSNVNVVPVRFGAGTLNKVIEALALGIPTVATSMSIAGLPPEIRKYIFKADTPEEFVDRISLIFEDEDIRNVQMKEAQTLVLNMLSWDKIVGEFESYIASEIKKINPKE